MAHGLRAVPDIRITRRNKPEPVMKNICILIKNVDFLQYTAKKQGKSIISFFARAMFQGIF